MTLFLTILLGLHAFGGSFDLLQGKSSSNAIKAIRDVENEDRPLAVFGPAPNGPNVSLNSLEITLRKDATVGEVNKLLISLGARIFISQKGLNQIVIFFPAVNSYKELDAIMSKIKASSQILKASPNFKKDLAG